MTEREKEYASREDRLEYLRDKIADIHFDGKLDGVEALQDEYDLLSDIQDDMDEIDYLKRGVALQERAKTFKDALIIAVTRGGGTEIGKHADDDYRCYPMPFENGDFDENGKFIDFEGELIVVPPEKGVYGEVLLDGMAHHRNCMCKVCFNHFYELKRAEINADSWKQFKVMGEVTDCGKYVEIFLIEYLVNRNDIHGKFLNPCSIPIISKNHIYKDKWEVSYQKADNNYDTFPDKSTYCLKPKELSEEHQELHRRMK